MEINKIHKGDCLDIMAEMPDGFVDCIVTDPPYFMPAVHYNTRKEFKRNFADLGIMDSWFKSVFKEFRRILKPTGTIYMFCDGQSYPLFYWHTYHFAKSVKPIIWDKMTSINGYGWRHQHEIIMWAEMPKREKIPTGDGDIIKCRAVPVNDRIHPAQKPVELLEKLILKSTNEGDLIFDPFAGSGSCFAACKKSKRNFIGAEMSDDYYSNGFEKTEAGGLFFNSFETELSNEAET